MHDWRIFMLSFESDYNNGAHPEVLRRLIETNDEPTAGYGSDRFTESAKAKIRAACGAPDADVYLLVGGTQTNTLVIATMLDDTEGVVCAETGHINTHEAGGVEYTGHKVLALPGSDGKLCADTLCAYLSAFFADENHDHAVFPGMVYISHPTEYGTLYTKAELSALSDVCRRFSLPLYLDGARLGYGLASTGTDVTLADVAAYCDAFYIGGTKVGALCGEAVVFPKNNAPKRFFTKIKQHGALLAKGRLPGVQFDALFSDGLYFEISRHAILCADRMREIFRQKEMEFFIETITNQIFILLDDAAIARLAGKVTYSFWEKRPDGRTVVRFATSWATRLEDVEALAALL